MEIGVFFLYCALFFAFIDLTVNISAVKGRKEATGKFAFLAGIFTAATFLLFWYYFLADNFLILQVFQNSNRGLALPFKLSAIWASVSGPLLFWSFLHYVAYIIVKRSVKTSSKLFLTLSIIGFYFLVISLLSEPFASTGFFPVDGRGLNPLLRNIWMIIHPPITFAGYCLAAIPLSIALTTLSGGDSKLEGLEKLLMEICWLLFTLNVVTGAIWAYESFTPGSYWLWYPSWDPVETGSLLPWLVCTAYFHAKVVHEKLGRLKELIIISAFLLGLLSTVTIMGGPVFSIHAFFSETFTLQASQLIVLIVMIGAVTVAILIRYPPRIPSRKSKASEFFSIESLHATSCIILLIVAFIFTLSVVYPIVAFTATGSLLTVGYEYNHYAGYPLILILIALSASCSLLGHLSKRKIALLMASALIIGILSALIGLTKNPLADFGIPALTLFSLAIFSAIMKDFSSRRLSLASIKLVHLSVPIILLGVLLSSTMRISAPTVYAAPGETIWISEEIEMRVEEIVTKRAPDSSGYEVEAICSVFTEGEPLGRLSVVRGREINEAVRMDWTIAPVSILRMPAMDVYVYSPFEAIFTELGEIDRMSFSVGVVKFMNLVWIGSLIMSISIIPPILISAKKLKEGG